MSRVKNIFKGNAGFTLIELLIVIVIIGVLATIAVPNLFDLTDSADEQAVRANARTLLIEVEAERTKSSDDRISIDELNAHIALLDMDEVAEIDGDYDSDSITIKMGDDSDLDNIALTGGRITTTGG